MRILLFGDSLGIPQLLSHIPQEYICGLVAAANRTQYHDHLRQLANDMGFFLLFSLCILTKAMQIFAHGLSNSSQT